MKLRYLLLLSFFICIFGIGYFGLNENIPVEKPATYKNIPEDIKEKILEQQKIKEKNEVQKQIVEQDEKINSSTGYVFTNSTGSIIEEELVEEVEKNNSGTGEKELEIKKQNLGDFNISKKDYIGNIDNLIKFSGETLDEIVLVNIGEKSFIPNIIDGLLYVLVEKNNNFRGEYDVSFKLSNGNTSNLKEKIIFSVTNEPFIVSNITPKNIKNDIARNIVLQGEGFKKTISIQLSNNIVLKATSFNIINDNVLIIKIPEGLDIGKYSLNIMGTEGIFTPNIQITISE